MTMDLAVHSKNRSAPNWGLEAPLKKQLLVDYFQEFCNSGTIADLYVPSGRKRAYALVDFDCEDDLCRVLQESAVLINGGVVKVQRAIFIPARKGKTSQAKYLHSAVVPHPQLGKSRCPSTVTDEAPSPISPSSSILPDEEEMLKEMEAVHGFLEANSMRPSLDDFLNGWL